MNQRRRDGWDDEAGGILGAHALGGPALAGLYGLGRSTREGGGLGDLGPAPIGSDPWLTKEILAALRTRPALRESRIEVEVREMRVTLSGHVAHEGLVTEAVRAAEGVPGVGPIRSTLTWG